jgi:histidyl-tRNA synthetase
VSAGPSFSAPVGTRDVLPGEAARWERLIATFAGLIERAGYGLLHTPLFEDLGVFQRLGEGTDVVRKEMYDFEDKGGRRVALRPEGTASVTRAYAQHRPQVNPWKIWYLTPAFRYERPQAGRYRQHHQVGVEALGSPDPDLDVEVIALGHEYLAALGLRRVTLLFNSLGTPADRVAYIDLLRGWLTDRLGDLDPDDRARVETNPMRVLDSKRAATRDATADAPRITDHLSPDAARHFERVLEGLRALEIDVVLEPRLVRGLDYYNHSLFEFTSDVLDTAQAAVLGGGRYDGLVEALGGPPTPGVGFGSGIERVLLACDAEGVFDVPEPSVDVFVVDVTGGDAARDLTVELRRTGIAADRAFDARSMRAQMKAADRSGAALALIVGPKEAAGGQVTVRDLRGHDHRPDDAQTTIARDQVAVRVNELLAAARPTSPSGADPATEER